MKYLVIIEKANNNYSAYLPDVPGCVATGRTIEEVKKNLEEALALHIESMTEEGLPIPEPKAQADYVAL